MIEIVKQIALDAGKIIMNYFEGDYEVKSKEDHSPCTIADEEADAFILAELKKNFPDDGILTEESVDDHSRLNKDRVWIVDPLDGTKQFVMHNRDFCVMIGLAVRGKPVLGVVYVPAKGELYWAEKDKGAFLQKDGETKQIHVRNEKDWSKLILITRVTSDPRKLDMLIDGLGVTNHMRKGAAGIKICAIASGIADMHVNADLRTKEWDTCAPQIILEEAGGTVSDLRGNPLGYNQKDTRHTSGFMACDKLHFNKMTEKIKAIIEKHQLL